MNLQRRALIVGIDHYQQANMDLQAAVADACTMEVMLASHQDGSANYDCLLWADQTDRGERITRAALRRALRQLFGEFRGEVLLYFSGYGTIHDTGGWLVTYDGTPDDLGISLAEVFGLAMRSLANSILLILDCRSTGSLESLELPSGPRESRETISLRENMTVIAASTSTESFEGSTGGHSLFTAAILSALEGGAADPMGWVTAASIYTYVERRFGGWNQQPVYKSNATRVSMVRQCAPLIERLKLARLVELFPSSDFRYQLDPEFEPEDEHGNVHEPVNKEKVSLALLLKEYRDAGLLKPSVPGEQLYWTSRRYHTVELTPRGKEYWWLVKSRKL